MFRGEYSDDDDDDCSIADDSADWWRRLANTNEASAARGKIALLGVGTTPSKAIYLGSIAIKWSKRCLLVYATDNAESMTIMAVSKLSDTDFPVYANISTPKYSAFGRRFGDA